LQLAEGLWVMVLGMGLVFLSLTALMFAMMILERVFRVQEEGAEEKGVPVAVSPAVAAAAAVAVARARAEARRVVAVTAAPAARGEARHWDWLWDEGIDDYGTTKGSDYANL